MGWHVTRLIFGFVVLGGLLVLPGRAGAGAEVGAGGVYSVVELSFKGPPQKAADAPARDIDFWVRFRHESGSPEYKVHGFPDGDGRGGLAGDLFKVRFCPTKAGRWELVEVHSNAKELAGQKKGDHVTATPSKHLGFWTVDAESPGRRWYRRSDGAHPYILGNTHYSFLSGYRDGDRPSGNDIAADIKANAQYFKKLRFGLQGDHYPHPTEKPFLDKEGRPTDWGDHSHRPNPKWFHERVDLAVRTAYEQDLIADLILAGPDREESRSTLRARENGGDSAPYLKYIAARYGSYPNVWLCLTNEYDIRKPTCSEKEIAGFGQVIQAFLPYPTPLSVHASSSPQGGERSDALRPAWSSKFDDLPIWNDHQIIQRKLKKIAPAADIGHRTWQNTDGKKPRSKPTINDELSYQGDGDKHEESDTIESHLGAFLGGGYGTTGFKTGNKTGHYFWGKFDPGEHTAADNLKWLRETIDAHVTFWKMAPDLEIFAKLDPGFRGMAWPGQEYVLGTNKAHKGMVAKLPGGVWTVTQYDVIAKKVTTLSKDAAGQFTFDAPDSRAVLVHFQRNPAADK